MSDEQLNLMPPELQTEGGDKNRLPNSARSYDYKKQIKRHRNFKILVITVIIILLLLIVFGALYQVVESNSYRIMVDGKMGGELTLSFQEDFRNSYSVLRGTGVKGTESNSGSSFSEGIRDYVEKIASGEIKMEIDDSGQNGAPPKVNENDEYVASKFYLKNDADIGKPSSKCKMTINVLENSKNALAAARFMIIANTERPELKTSRIYAQPAATGGCEKVATKARGSNYYVADPSDPTKDWECINLKQHSDGTWDYDSWEQDGIYYELAPQEIIGYCIAVWYEGSDPEHSNLIIGGYITFSIVFATI